MSDAKDPAQPGASLLRSLLSTGTKADLLQLFHRNPGLIDTVDGIARRVGKKPDAIRTEVSELQGESILLKKKVGNRDVYFLNRERDSQAQEEIARYIKSVGEKRSP